MQGMTAKASNQSQTMLRKATAFPLLLLLFLTPSVVKIQRVRNIKIKSKVGIPEVRFSIGRNKALVYCIKTELKRCIMTSSLRNIYLTSRTSRRRYQSSVRLKWRERRGHLHWTHPEIRLRWAGKLLLLSL